MTEQPEALRLAEWLEGSDKATDELAAAELRRLYQLAQEQHTEIYGLRLQVRNLMEACETLAGLPDTDDWVVTLNLAVRQARAAIAVAKGGA